MGKGRPHNLVNFSTDELIAEIRKRGVENS
jgi:hypothetical protein